jgi:hypothetical protein
MQLLYVALDSYMSEKNYEDTLQRSVLVFPVFFLGCLIISRTVSSVCTGLR